MVKIKYNKLLLLEEFNIKSNQKHKLLFITFIIFSFLLIGSYIAIDKIFFGNKAQNVALENAVKKTKERESVLKSFLEISKESLEAIREHSAFNQYIENGSNKESLLEAMMVLAKSEKDIMQLRYIDKTGMEKIRIERDILNSSPYIKADEQLQDKSSRYYFTNSKQLKSEKVWFSALDLNKEYGKIEEPFKPTLRAILPVVTSGEFQGVLIVNYFMKDMLKTFTNAPLYDMIICDSKGYNLYHYESAKRWGFYKKEKYHISDEFPKHFKQILSKDFMKTDSFVSRELALPLHDKITLILQLKKQYLENQKEQILQQYLIVSWSSFFLSFILAYLVVRVFSKTLLNLDELKIKEEEIGNLVVKLQNINNNLEEKVKEEVNKNKVQEQLIYEQAKQAQMGDMIGNIAHQWRQPLSVISTAATGLLMEKQLQVITDEKLEKSLNLINDHTQYLSNTIETFRNYINENKDFKRVVLQDRIDKAIDIVDASLKNHHIKLENHTRDGEDVEISLIIGELLEVIINIINNAKDVLLDREIIEPIIKLDLLKSENKVTITIEDNAGGIEKDILPRIFEPYYTTKHKSIGTGLGLYMSKSIIEENLDGKLYVENTELGAKFFIELDLEH